MSENKEKKKSLAKDIVLLLSVWGPLLFIIIGGTLWRNGKFDGTIMEQLFPALFFGLIAGFFVLVILSNLFRNYPAIWVTAGLIILVATVILYMLNLKSVLLVELIVVFGIVLLFALIKWIAKTR